MKPRRKLSKKSSDFNVTAEPVNSARERKDDDGVSSSATEVWQQRSIKGGLKEDGRSGSISTSTSTSSSSSSSRAACSETSGVTVKSSFSATVRTTDAADKIDLDGGEDLSEFDFEETYFPPKFWDVCQIFKIPAFRRSYADEAKRLIPLTVPVLLAEASTTSMTLIDTIMSGHVSPTDQAAVAVAASLYSPSILFALGFLFALPPIVSQLHGAKKSHLVAHQLNQFLCIDLLLCVIIMIILWFGYPIISSMQDVNPDLAGKTRSYLRWVTFSVPPYIVYTTLRCCCEGLSNTVPGMIFGLSALIVHVPVNYVCIYGHLGLPKMGGVGCGASTLAVTWYMAVMMSLYVYFSQKTRRIGLLRVFSGLDLGVMWEQTKIGLPIALSVFFESGLFAVVAMLLSPLGAVEVAGHNVAQSFESLFFQLFLSCTLATTVRVGRNLGAGRYMRAVIACHTGSALSLLCFVFSAVLILSLRPYITVMYTTDKDEQKVAFRLLKYCVMYQVFDCQQVVFQGCLRGYKDTLITTVITLVSFWGVGFSIGYLLGLTNVLRPRMGADGFWIGFIAGLSVVAILLALRTRYVQTRPASDIARRIGVGGVQEKGVTLTSRECANLDIRGGEAARVVKKSASCEQAAMMGEERRETLLDLEKQSRAEALKVV